ncbi:MAG: 50S ribosomal protein L23 [Bacteroidota bacterium]
MKNVIIKPIVTEKMTDTTERLGQYGFIVDKKANKVEIKDAISALYGVTVEKVRTMNYSGKKSSRYTKAGLVKGKKNDFKKAIVELSEGESIDIFAGI